MEDRKKARDTAMYATNTLTLSEKSEQDIADAKRRVDENEK